MGTRSVCNVAHPLPWNSVHSLLERWLHCPFAHALTYSDVLNGAWAWPVQECFCNLSQPYLNKWIIYLDVHVSVWKECNICIHNYLLCAWKNLKVWVGDMCACPPFTRPKLDSPRAKMTKCLSPQPVWSSISLIISFSFPPLLTKPAEIDDIVVITCDIFNEVRLEFKMAPRSN